VIAHEGAVGLRWARAFCEQGDYAASLNEAERVLRSFPEAGDKALFQIGLVQVCPSNPKKDFNEALEAFHRIQKEFPESPLGSEAAVMEMLIQEVLEGEGRLAKLAEENKKLSKQLGLEQEATETLKAEAEAFRVRVEELKGQLLKLKEIDLVLEEKKNQTK
jgi:hypothetical protein